MPGKGYFQRSVKSGDVKWLTRHVECVKPKEKNENLWDRATIEHGKKAAQAMKEALRDSPDKSPNDFMSQTEVVKKGAIYEIVTTMRGK